MTDAEYLKFLRRRLRDVDTDAPLYTDTTLWEYSLDALRELKARKTSGFTDYSIATTAPLGATPDLVDDDGVLLASKTAALLLHDLYTEKVRSGSLGVSWESGLERESTIDQRKAYAEGIKALESYVEELIIIRASSTSGKRYH